MMSEDETELPNQHPATISNRLNSDADAKGSVDGCIGRAGPSIPELTPEIKAEIFSQPPAREHPSQVKVENTVRRQITQSQIWQGPFPPPEALERYERILPGAFNRILTMAENMESAQIKQSSDALSARGDDTQRGHWFGFLVGIAAFVGAIIVGLENHDWLAAAFLTVPVMGLAKSFVDSSRSEGKEPKEQTEPVKQGPPSK